MREGGNVVEAEHGARPFDGMQRPEKPTNQFRILGNFFQGQKRRLELA